MVDIVGSLMNKAIFDCITTDWDYTEHLCWRAAKEIEKLRTENISLRDECRSLESSINRMLND